MVVDASVGLKWFLADKPDEQHVENAMRLLASLGEGAHAMVEPLHFTVEILAVLARVAPDRLPAARHLLGKLSFQTVATDAVLERGLELAVSLRHHLFDTLYHAVALETGATLVTADDRYFKVASAAGHIQRLADWAG